MALREELVQYRLGFGLHFVGLFLLLSSVAIPDAWVYDNKELLSEKPYGLSVWDQNVRICFVHGRSNWRCGTVVVDKDKLTAALFCFFASPLIQLAACVLLVVNSVRDTYFLAILCPEALAGLAIQLSLTGILIYVSVTYFADNILYGPGFILNISAIVIIFAGLILSGLYRRSKKPLKIAV